MEEILEINGSNTFNNNHSEMEIITERFHYKERRGVKTLFDNFNRRALRSLNLQLF